MKTAVIWLLLTYAALKLASIAQARNPGFRRTDVRLRDRLRAREPGLFLAAFLLAVPMALLANGYVHRSLTAQYESSATCFGRLMALRGVPGFKDEIDNSAVFQVVEGHRGMALRTAVELKLKPADVSKALAAKVELFAVRYARLNRQGAQHEMLIQIGMAQRCLSPDGARI